MRRATSLAYPRLLGAIAEVGVCALVDGFFGIDDLLDILDKTKVERVLIRPASARRPNEITALAAAVEKLPITRPFEVRSSDHFHDRYVFPDVGPVRQIGTSLRGVGR